MLPVFSFAQIMSDDELEQLHEGALAILEDPGMRIENQGLLKALKNKGATVDFEQEIAKFPRKMVEETIEIAVREDNERLLENNGSPVGAKEALAFSWHTPFPDGLPEPQYSFGCGCPLHYNYSDNSVHQATAQDFLDLINLAEGIPEIRAMGNPVHYLSEFDGAKVPPKMIAIKGAALVAKHSSKPGTTALMYAEQLDYLIEIGSVIRGSFEEYRMRPILINVNDAMTPLRLSRHEGKIVEALAAKRLPVSILPMPLMGIACPITPVANAILCVAEILGVWATAKSVSPDVPVEGIAASGVIEPSAGSVVFSGPEPPLIDVMVAQLFRRRYGVRCGVGTGLIDASAPGTAAMFERTFKMAVTAACGEFNFPVGILAGGNIFSPEQAMLDMDVAAAVYRFFKGAGDDEFNEAVDLIREKGIGGVFMDTEHTAKNLRKQLCFYKTFKRNKTNDPEDMKKQDPVRLAHERWREILASTSRYELEDDRIKEIDKIVQRAEKHLGASDGTDATF